MHTALLLALQAPHGPVAEFLVLFAVVLIAPLLVERARIPGIIGLLAGGWLIGPHGIEWIDTGSQTVPELGQLGLLYLMFVAGLELDLGVLRRYRRAAATFGLLTFLVPFGAGAAVGWSLGWTTSASLLLGSLLASHTLICYPTLRDAGHAADPAVASAVGATVLTDTLALVVLAGVAGTETGDGSAFAVLGEVAIGLIVLVAVGGLAVPRLASLALSRWGDDRAARYLVAVVSFLLMAAVAEVFGIEGIVGAFFAGLALNRLVPNGGPSMDQIEFFGSAVFIPVFLVSVGLLLDPAVMFSGETLGIAGLLCLACLGGKAIAAAATSPLLGLTAGQALAIFSLSTPQAAATLAATLVGFEIGLFGTAVVNAVLLLILVSIVVSTLIAVRVARRLNGDSEDQRNPGDHVLLAIGADGPTSAALQAVAALTIPDGGIVEVILAVDRNRATALASSLRSIERSILRAGLDGSARVVVDRTAADAVVNAALGSRPTTVLIDRPAIIVLPSPNDLVNVPVVSADDVGWVVHLCGVRQNDGEIVERLASTAPPELTPQ